MRQSKVATIAAALVAVAALGGCTKEKRPYAPGTASASGAPTLSSIQGDILTLSCAVSGCHDNRANPAASLDLTNAAASYSGLVNRMSTEAQMKIVTPEDPGNSYLYHKLMGTHRSVGGTGDQMPQYAAQLSQADIDRIVQWITDGAQYN